MFTLNINLVTCPHIKVEILGTEIKGLLDSGASISVISSLDLIRRWDLKLQEISLKVQTANGEKLRCLGFVYLPVTFNSMTKVIPTVVIPEISKDLICGYDFWQAFDIRPTSNGTDITLMCSNRPIENVSKDEVHSISLDPLVFCISVDSRAPEVRPSQDVDDSLDIPTLEDPTDESITAAKIDTEHELKPEEKEILVDVINTFPRSYEGKIGRTSLLQHTIELLPDAKPKKIPSYKYSPTVEKEVDKEINRLLELDAIEECASEFINP